MPKAEKYERECLEYAFGSTNIFGRALQKFVSFFVVWVGVGVCVEVSLRTACCCQKWSLVFIDDVTHFFILSTLSRFNVLPSQTL